MRQTFLRPLAVISALAVGISCSGGSEPVTVRQNVLSEMAVANVALEETCTSQHPALEAAFHDATANYQSRIASVLDALLETDDFKSLAQASAPQAAIGLYSQSAALIREQTLSRQECDRILGDFNGLSDERIKANVSEMLITASGLIDMEKQSKE